MVLSHEAAELISFMSLGTFDTSAVKKLEINHDTSTNN
jgi:hypothetical protein